MHYRPYSWQVTTHLPFHRFKYFTKCIDVVQQLRFPKYFGKFQEAFSILTKSFFTFMKNYLNWQANKFSFISRNCRVNSVFKIPRTGNIWPLFLAKHFRYLSIFILHFTQFILIFWPFSYSISKFWIGWNLKLFMIRRLLRWCFKRKKSINGRDKHLFWTVRICKYYIILKESRKSDRIIPKLFDN